MSITVWCDECDDDSDSAKHKLHVENDALRAENEAQAVEIERLKSEREDILAKWATLSMAVHEIVAKWQTGCVSSNDSCIDLSMLACAPESTGAITFVSQAALAAKEAHL